MKRRQIKKLIKKMVIIGGLVFSFFVPTCNSFAMSGVGQKVVMIEAGHGGRDVGAIAIDGSHEADRNLDLANNIAKHLQARGIKVIFTRLSDNYTHVNEIVQIANRVEEVDFVLNVHYNANDNKSARGVETYYNNPTINGTETYDNKGRLIGEEITQQLSSTLNTTNRGNKPSPFYNRRIAKSSVLVETGFITNPVENEKLYTHQEEIAQEIAEAIANNL